MFLLARVLLSLKPMPEDFPLFPLPSLCVCHAGLCPVGHFCPAGSSSPLRCPAGLYGGVGGLVSEACSGPCDAGYFCEEGATSPRSDPDQEIYG